MHILLVEDEAAHAMLVRRAFESRGEHYTLEIAGTLREAMVLATERPPNIAVIDLRLPDGDGIEFLTAFPDRRAYPVVIMTSHGDEQVAVEAMKAGALDYVVKSEAMLAEMPRIVERVLREWGHILQRQRVEKALRDSESRFRGLFEHTPVSIWEIDCSFVRTYLDALKLEPDMSFTDFMEWHPGVLFECARRVRVLGVNQASVEQFDAPDAATLAAALPDLLAEEMASAFKAQLVAMWERRTFIEIDITVRTLQERKRAFVMRWAVPPGHEETCSRVLISMSDVTTRKRLEKEVLDVSTSVQRRIGSDLHDGLGQLLAGTRFKIARLHQKLLRLEVGDVADMAAQVDDLVAEAISQARALARGLNPVSMEVGGLGQALEDMVKGLEKIYDQVRFLVDCDDADQIRDQKVAGQVYYIAKEAMNNAMKHAKATKMYLSLRITGERATLSVQDNGIGLGEERRQSKGQGLRIMAYRAGMIQGTLDVQDVPTGGTRVVCNFLINTPPPEHAEQVYGAL